MIFSTPSALTVSRSVATAFGRQASSLKNDGVVGNSSFALFKHPSSSARDSFTIFSA